MAPTDGLNAKDNKRRTMAWKYVGYPGFSNYMASSTDCFAIRRFSALNVRVLLNLQDRIVRMEADLAEMDQYTMDLPDDQGGCYSVRLDLGTTRGNLMSELENALAKYGEHL